MVAVTNADHSRLNIPGVKFSGAQAIYRHSQTGLLVVEITNDADGLAVAKRNRALLMEYQATDAYRGHGFLAGMAFVDACNEQPEATTPAQIARAMADTFQASYDSVGGTTAGSKVRQSTDWFVAVALDDVRLSNPNTGLVNQTYKGAYTGVGGLVPCDAETPITDVSFTGELNTTFLNRTRFFTFIHGWHTGVGVDAIHQRQLTKFSSGSNDASVSKNNQCISGIARTMGVNAGAYGDRTPSHTATVLMPTSYSVGGAIKVLVSESDYPEEIEEAVRASLAAVGFTNLDDTRLYEPHQVSWVMNSGVIDAKFIDPLAPADVRPEYANLLGGMGARDMLIGTRVRMPNGYGTTLPVPLINNATLLDSCQNKFAAYYRCASLAGSNVPLLSAYKAVRETVDGFDTAQVFGMQPFALFYNITNSDWSTVERRPLTVGDYQVARNLAARAGVGRVDTGEPPSNTYGQNESGVVTTESLTAAVNLTLSNGDNAITSGRTQLDSHTLTARTLARLCTECVSVTVAEVYYNAEAANRILQADLYSYTQPEYLAPPTSWVPPPAWDPNP